ncbi:putative glycoside hydrolase [Staphylococcus nepalensis]|uniref:putative glycoside hydrolase n=1 Tax=Staphylococcus nepalensis TaxID=214473 RepID=UPI00227033FF|nr:putative glycoside hydrolase [Staphylococcus nepalensis]MCY1038265.1 putative glycoside hydrolase [Staphylococcus nepalensis]
MRVWKFLTIILAMALVMSACNNDNDSNNEKNSSKDKKTSQSSKDTYSKIDYPKDGVKGIYVALGATSNGQFDELVKFINDTELNAMVIDVKDDEGNITMDLKSDNKLIRSNTLDRIDAKKIIKEMEKNDIYPIARIVTFKDSKLSNQRPDWSFKTSEGNVWENEGGDSFTNPFNVNVWDYNLNVAKEAAKAGFKEIQFDYVRFPEGFENKDQSLQYSSGKYEESGLNKVEQRVDTITEFLKSARKDLKSYDVQTSADVFGYAATVKETPGIGQSFPKVAKNVDVISSMIYPSHWNPGDFGLENPDTEPYKTIDRYLDKEKEALKGIDSQKVKSRPWLQDFTASYLGEGRYKVYDKDEVTAQIQALKDHGIDEFLLWDASGNYTKGADYSPEKYSNPNVKQPDHKKDK